MTDDVAETERQRGLWDCLLKTIEIFFGREIQLAKDNVAAIKTKSNALGADEKATAMYGKIMKQVSEDHPTIFEKHYQTLHGQ